ncbi:MAG: Spo0B domain-containing protein [Acetobacteraceae bacterium]|nr:Spo0B domain-containing protein [Acetobacteraceae bacterium]
MTKPEWLTIGGCAVALCVALLVFVAAGMGPRLGLPRPLALCLWVAGALEVGGVAAVLSGPASPARLRRLSKALRARDLEFIQLTKNQRHSFMNHLQVLSGWLQLGRPERAQAYVEKLRVEMEEQRRLYSAGGPELVAFLLARSGMAEAQGTSLRFEVAPEFDRAREDYPWLLPLTGAVIDFLVQAGPERSPGDHLLVVLEAGEGWCGLSVLSPGSSLSPEDLEGFWRRPHEGVDPGRLRARTRALGGSWTLECGPQGGVTFRVRLPWRAA